MQRPDIVGSIGTKAETGISLDTSIQLSRSQAGMITRCVSLTDAATEVDHKRRARRQALLLMAASSIVTIGLLVGAWLALRRRF
jgi:hypothetical protein